MRLSRIPKRPQYQQLPQSVEVHLKRGTDTSSIIFVLSLCQGFSVVRVVAIYSYQYNEGFILHSSIDFIHKCRSAALRSEHRRRNRLLAVRFTTDSCCEKRRSESRWISLPFFLCQKVSKSRFGCILSRTQTHQMRHRFFNRRYLMQTPNEN
ncbi:uncharacterized protein [Palaemon carinicauda]|uniref:uncharacterized protein n=1 Tax=Palaemon carinicauda TaxID=392227 RepID=UPI0035B585C8